MKGLSSGRPQLTFTSGHTCGLPDCDQSLDHLQHVGPDSRSPYLLSPTESCPLDPHRCSPRSSIHSECMVMPVSMASDHVSSSTFPRMHYSSHQDSLRDDGSTSHGGGGGGGGVSIVSGGGGSGKMNRIPANLLDQFEKQLPIHRDGFHTLQYQRTSATTTNSEQRNESPGRIRHLVHSVQKLFTKSHSLEGSSKMNGTKGDSRSDSGHHHHHHHHHGHDHGSHKHSKRSKSKERKSDSKQRSGIAGWWSSDDNLDSDSTYRTPSIMSRHHGDHITHCYPDMGHGHFGDLSLKTSKSNNDVKCSACESIAMAPEGKFMKRSSWSTLTVSQAKEAYRKSSLNLEKPTMPQDLKSSMRPCHFLQVPQDEWGGRDEEIPCRRMRSSSYVKAMGDQDSGDSDGSPKNSPQKMVRPNALVKSVLQRQLSDQSSYRLDKSSRDMVKYLTNITADLSQSYHLQTSREIHPSITLEPSPNYNSPKFRSRNQSYMRAVSTLSQASCVSQVSQVSETEVNGQFESVCESVFSEVESQAMDALDLPGCFRTRSHSYLRAIQAGFSQDDDCVPSMTSSTVTSTIRSTTEGNDVLEGTGLLNEDNLPSEGPDLTSMAHGNTGFRRRGDESGTLYGNGSPSRTPLFPPLKTSAPIRPRPVQSSVQETADLALAISQQWREDVSAMRKELAELRKDLCTELRAFNRNFSTFTQHYSTWSPSCVRETQTAAPQVSVSTQAGSKTLVRQNTADAAVNCPSPVDPSVLSMSPSEPADRNVLQVSTSSPFFQTDPNSELADIDDPTFANLTPPDPVDVTSLCWPDLDSDSMTPPDPPEPVPEVESYCFTKSSTPEHVESIVLDFTNVELVNLASLQWPKLDPEDTGSSLHESLDQPSPGSPEELGPCTPELVITTTQERSVLESMQPLLLSHLDEEQIDFTLPELDPSVLSPLTLDSMNLHDLKWPSLESLELNVSGSQSPGPLDLALPNPPTPETVYTCSFESTAQEPPLPELLDTIYLQPATPEPESRTDSDISNPASPEPHFPTCQKSSTHELDSQALVLWSKKDTFMIFREEDGAESCSEEKDGQNVASSDTMINFAVQSDAVDSGPLESETLFSAVLCSIESDTFDPEVTSMDEPTTQGSNPPGLATIDPATVHPFNLSLLELQSALDVSKSETSDNGSPKGTAAISSPSYSPSRRDFLWIRWQRKTRGRQPMSRSASMEIYHKKYSNNSEMSYMSLSL
nr:disks large-associated protein 2 isoform X1 [Danio rerio]XP_021323094.1 disks large-associated protein 2 isoform X1 [Danio rerio]XP_021328848.1 disks large-associated protein 2 isoform X1 [Danio rerio]|eukprot:XP_021323093.1 disks large-associated protein 2 isoform X1 [Danio rerio]